MAGWYSGGVVLALVVALGIENTRVTWMIHA